MWFVWRWLWLLFLAVSSAPGCNRTAPPCWRTPSLSRSCPGSRTLHRTHLQRGVTQMCLHECWCMLPLLCNNGSRYSACVEKRETWIIERLEVCNVWINVQVVSQWGFSPASRCSWEIYQYYKISDIVTSWYGQSVVLSLFQRVHYSKVLSQTKESLIPTIRKMLDWHIPNGRCRTTLQSNVIRSMTPIFLSQHHRSVPRIKSNDSQVYFLGPVHHVRALCLQTYPRGSVWCSGAGGRRWSRSLAGCESCPGRLWCAPCGSTWSPPEGGRQIIKSALAYLNLCVQITRFDHSSA